MDDTCLPVASKGQIRPNCVRCQKPSTGQCPASSDVRLGPLPCVSQRRISFETMCTVFRMVDNHRAGKCFKARRFPETKCGCKGCSVQNVKAPGASLNPAGVWVSGNGTRLGLQVSSTGPLTSYSVIKVRRRRLRTSRFPKKVDLRLAVASVLCFLFFLVVTFAFHSRFSFPPCSPLKKDSNRETSEPGTPCQMETSFLPVSADQPLIISQSLTGQTKKVSRAAEKPKVKATLFSMDTAESPKSQKPERCSSRGSC